MSNTAEPDKGLLVASSRDKGPDEPREVAVSPNTDVAEEVDRQPKGVDFPVVGIGASAGGLEAYTELLTALPATTGMAFVLVQHLDPAHPSLLTSLLSKTTTMPVVEARDGMSLEPNNVYVIPPNKGMTISGGALRLAPRIGRAPFLPVDLFLTSLAHEQRRLAIGVILSGTASDGSEGIRAIKALCGITFTQDGVSAQYGGMPRTAQQTGAVDFVLSPAEIAKELDRISQHRFLVGTHEPESVEVLPEGQIDLSRVFQLLERTTNVDFSLYKQTTVRRRIGRRMIVHRCETIAAYLAVLQREPKEIQELYQDILISVTGFFRDPAAFEALRTHLTKLVNETAEDSVLRVWVPGCATGEEVYSLAISFREILEEQGRKVSVQFFGTDISEVALRRARSGVYPEISALKISPERLREFFHKVDGGYQINKSIRDTCVFATQDVTRDPPFARLDLISCRNLLIYLGQALQKSVFSIFHYALNANGILFLGSAEATDGSSGLFRALEGGSNIYTPSGVPVRSNELFPHRRRRQEPADRPSATRRLTSLELQKRADRTIQNRYAPDGVVIDAGMQILQFRGHTGFYLEAAAGEASHHLIRMARESIQPILRKAVATAIERNTLVQEKGVRVTHGGETREITIEVVPIGASNPNEHYYLVMFDRTTPQRELPPDAPAPEPIQEDRQTRVERLERELSEAREYLRSETEDHETALEELRAANEEVGSANEELQSTNEQLGTAKEELQSTNEELITVNEELKSRNDELHVSTNDLTNLLSAADLPILVVDRVLRLRRFTPRAEQWLGLVPADVGRSLADVQKHLPVPQLASMVRKVIDSLATEVQEVQDSHGAWWLLTIHPYRTSEHRIEGAVLTFVDIDSIQRNLQAANEAHEFSEAIVNTVREPLLVLTRDLRVARANPAFYETFQVTPENTEGRLLYELGHAQWDISPLRHALKEVLLHNVKFVDLEVEQTFPGLGLKSMCLNGCRIIRKEGGAQAILLAVEDVTQRRDAEQALKRSNEDLERFAYVVSHDLREPLRTVGSFSDLIATRYKGQLDEKADEFFGLVNEGVKRMNGMISDLLAYSQVGSSDATTPPEIASKSALEEALWNLQSVIADSGARVTRDELPAIRFNNSQLIHVFQNLIGNAIKYRRAEESPRIHVSAQQVDSGWEFSVRDNGLGFSVNDAGRIFDVFTRLHGREYSGTGIGLAICKRIVEHHRGRIWVESEVGVGSTFRFSVPH